MGEAVYATPTELLDADDYVVVQLVDGSQVNVYGDGLVYFYQHDKARTLISKTNLYVNDGEEV
jgi:hypothetical protein